MKLGITFGLKAVKKFDGTFLVAEVFETEKKDTIPGRPAVQASDFIDESVKKSHAKEYAEFHSFVETYAERLYPEAIMIFPKVLPVDPSKPLLDEIPEQVAEVIPETVVKKSKKKEKGE